jgi:hypothetical protein
MNKDTSKLEFAVLNVLAEAGEEELIALYYLVYEDQKVTAERVQLLASAAGSLARRGEIALGLTRGVAAAIESWAAPEMVADVFLSWLKVVDRDGGKGLELAGDGLVGDLRPVVIDKR